MGDFGIFSISVKELIHCEGGGRWHWAVSALMGLQKLSHWSLTCFMEAAEQLPSSLHGEMQSFRVTGARSVGGSPLKLMSLLWPLPRPLPTDCEPLGIGTLFIFGSLSQKRHGWDSVLHPLCPVSSVRIIILSLQGEAFPHSLVGKKSACHAGDLGLISGSGRSPGEGNGNPLQYSCLENPMDRGALQATVHGVAREEHDLATKPPNHLEGRMKST